ncbi:hypothetical protein [Bacteriovorax sp. DB6_IX]|uniref:hypothetical protein n=1 Tax=Bacteriovorax sp. DB6_IX TaxID=1353530 RepID=UPI00038A4A83|nr:hypothetical protein [Bacteriovorax sp. DB6_IX]EQC50589.1 hypothetical protein M901_2185 [Bacteriovorax sp. DB6_IX]
MTLKRLIVLISIILSAFSSLANQEVEKQIFDVSYYKKFVEEVALTQEFNRGEYLVYDCRTKHFICVNRAGQKLCLEMLENSKEVGSQERYCLPIRKFKDQLTCFRKQYEVSQKTSMEKFCRYSIN